MNYSIVIIFFINPPTEGEISVSEALRGEQATLCKLESCDQELQRCTQATVALTSSVEQCQQDMHNAQQLLQQRDLHKAAIEAQLQQVRVNVFATPK